MFGSNRLSALVLAGAVALLASSGVAQLQSLDRGGVVAAVERLKPGEFLWAPQIAPQGPMLVVVNIATQRLVAYRNGVPIAVSTVSTGRPGHRTPTGVFTILQKRAEHYSSKYNRAPMPFMQRLTWGGIALHGGALPGYPASHGCIRLPHAFAPLLFAETALGMTVVIVNQPTVPRVAPAPLLLRPAPGPAGPAAPMRWQPELSPNGPVSIVVSGADRRMVVLRNGIEIGSAPVEYDGVIDHVQAFVVDSIRDGETQWRRVPLPGQGTGPAPEDAAAAQAATPRTDAFRVRLATVIHPGATLIVLPDSLGQAPNGPMTVIDNAPPGDLEAQGEAN